MTIAVLEMLELAQANAKDGTYYADALDLLDRLVAKKAMLDATHPDASEATQRIVDAVRAFIDDNTIPCTEWPTTLEIAQCVEAEATAITNASAE